MIKLVHFFRKLGPGLITGAADDDPSGIATYAQTGAKFGLNQLWTAIFMLPLMIAVQEACGRIGAVTGRGIAGVLKEKYPKWLLYSVVLLVAFANTVNIGADIGAMAEAAKLIVPVDFIVLAILFTVLILVLEIFTSYRLYSRVLKWLTLSLIAYPITAIIAGQDYGKLLYATFVPHIEFTSDFLFLIVGVLGTTISPYMFFWQASEEVEEEIEEHRLAQRGGVPRISKTYIKWLRLDTFTGMVASEIATWFIILVGASTLHAHGVTSINTAADAAKALEPLVAGFPYAGFLAKSIFAIGIIGLGLLGVPVLAGSASYALSEAFGWKEGLYLKLKKAHGFYGVITIAMLIGLLINFVGIDPVQALVFAAVVNGVVAVPLLFVIAKISSNKKIMGEYTNRKLSSIVLWTTFAAMGIASIAMLVSFVR